jgi:hypothetical protein
MNSSSLSWQGKKDIYKWLIKKFMAINNQQYENMCVCFAFTNWIGEGAGAAA